MAIAGFSESYVFGPSGFWTLAPLRYTAKFDPFLSLDCGDCAPTPSILAQSKEMKGSNFAIWQHWRETERNLRIVKMKMMRVTYRRKSASGVLADTEISPDIRLREHFEGKGERGKRKRKEEGGNLVQRLAKKGLISSHLLTLALLYTQFLLNLHLGVTDIDTNSDI